MLLSVSWWHSGVLSLRANCLQERIRSTLRQSKAVWNLLYTQFRCLKEEYFYKPVYRPTAKPLQSLEWLLNFLFSLCVLIFTEETEFMRKRKLVLSNLSHIPFSEYSWRSMFSIKNTAVTRFVHCAPFSIPPRSAVQWISERPFKVVSFSWNNPCLVFMLWMEAAHYL